MMMCRMRMYRKSRDHGGMNADAKGGNKRIPCACSYRLSYGKPQELPYEFIDFPLYVGYNINGVMVMSLLTEAVTQEQQRIERMIQKYESELYRLPKGTLITKSIKGNQYCYLQYRNGQKTVSEYIGRDREKIEEIKEQIERRRHIQTMLKALNEEFATAQKMLEVCV